MVTSPGRGRRVNSGCRTHRAVVGCGGFFIALSLLAAAGGAAPGRLPKHPGRAALQHIVVIVQENRTVDNLFQKLPGADTQSYGIDSHGNTVPLRPVSLSIPWDPLHTHSPTKKAGGGFVTEYANGLSNGWDLESFKCTVKQQLCSGATAFAYVRPSEVRNYYDFAKHYAFGDEMLQTNEGPSFPAHQYLIAGQTGGLFDQTHHYAESENPHAKHMRPYDHGHGTGGCDNPTSMIPVIDILDPYPGIENTSIFPCEDYETIFDLLDAHPPVQETYNWRYYTPAEASIWDAPMGVEHLYQKYLEEGGSQTEGNFAIDPGGTLLQRDITNGTLPPLTYIAPCSSWSDHAGSGTAEGPLWVSWIANQIGASQYWANTAIIVVWDDWGGWYDHVVPGHRPNVYRNVEDPLEYGYRVPILVISPFAKHGYVDHTPDTQMAILTFIEKVYGLPSLGAADRIEFSGGDLSGLFDFSQTVTPYHPEPVPTGLFPQSVCSDVMPGTNPAGIDD
jgi:phospholipase C